MEDSTESSSVAANDQRSSNINGANQPHTRTYQACIPCRQRKVRCDLGPVDNPHDPPCVRCRRESKECFFSSTRRKKRAADSGAIDDLQAEELEVRGGRKRLRDDTEDAGSDTPLIRGYSAYPLTPAGPSGQCQSLRRQTFSANPTIKDDQEDEQMSSQTAAILQNAELHSGHDALNVLLEAATHHRAGSGSSTRPSDMFQNLSPRGVSNMQSPALARQMPFAASSKAGHTNPPSHQRIDPAIQGQTSPGMAAGMTSALKAWSRFKFVRNGWFTAQEGMAYVEYFYTKLSPLTPVVMPDYGAPASHEALLSEEPMLTVAILTIASRHMELSGPGALSRPYAIHTTMWSYLEGMINRLVWGHEQFRRGLNADQSQPNSDVSPYTRRGLRTLGTVESLMLLTEWHPRSMHYPPTDDDSELLLPASPLPADHVDLNADPVKGISGQRIESWLEPCWRSDRICWALLSMAMSLAFEIGVFDEDTSRHLESDLQVTEEKRRVYENRRTYVRDMLLVYITQTSGRIGLTSMLPPMYSEPKLSALFAPANIDIMRSSSRDVVIHLWLNIASITKIGSKDLFPNRAHTREIIRSGRYRELLVDLYPQLMAWRRTFDAAPNIPMLMRHILNIEYEYARVYLNSLGMQAVVERCAEYTAQHNPQPMAPGSAKTWRAIPPEVLEKCYGKDRYYTAEVTEGCRNLLRTVTEGLCPQGHLRHAPVRTYFRIISVSIILLKSFALGATEDDVANSLRYMERTIEALRNDIVDDVHVASRFADLLSTLTNRIRSRFVRVSRQNGTGVSRSTSDSPVPQPFSQLPPPMQQSNMRSTLLPSWQQQTQQNLSQATPGAAPTAFSANPMSPSDPLFGISTQPYNIDYGNMSIMPPPSTLGSPLTHAGMGPNGGAYGGHYNADGDNGAAGDWLSIPLDPILSYQDVTQTGYGTGVGGFDMLDVLLAGAEPDPDMWGHGPIGADSQAKAEVR